MKKNPSILMVIDYPTIEDDAQHLLFSGLNPRAVLMSKLIKGLDISDSNFSYLSLCSCVTNSKAIIKPDNFIHCSNGSLKWIGDTHEILGIVCFGSLAGSIITGENIDQVEDARLKIYDSYIGNSTIPAVVTYSLSVLAGSSCGACGNANARQHLTRKDIDRLIIYLKKQGVKFKR